MTTSPRAAKRWPAWLIFSMAATPALVFYWLLWKSSFNLPVVDDYYAVLYFLNHFSQLPDLGSKLKYFGSFQHNEYKLWFEYLIFVAQYCLSGSVNFTILSMLGNACVLFLFLLLASIFRISSQSNIARVSLLLPVGFVLFQLQYASTLNFSMAGLQNITVLVFVLLSIVLLAKESSRQFAGACVAMLLAIAASGGGFLLVPVGVLMLAERRRWKHIGIWIGVFAVMAAVYFSDYNFHSAPSNLDGSVSRTPAHFDLLYMLAFMGSSVARYQGYLPSIAVGIVILVIWALAIRKGYSKENPTALYFCLFLILTGAGVSAIRSGLGMEQSLASRYRIYSNLLLILSYIFLVEAYLLKVNRHTTRLAVTGVAMASGLVFCVLSDMAGFRFLKGRQQAVTYEMAAWQAAVTKAGAHTNSPEGMNFDPAVSRQLATGLYKPIADVLTESIRLGIYSPPGMADLPLRPAP
jgi:hypothetical protein